MAGAVSGELLSHWLCWVQPNNKRHNTGTFIAAQLADALRDTAGFLKRHSATAIYIAHLYRGGLPTTAKANGDGITILNTVSWRVGCKHFGSRQYN